MIILCIKITMQRISILPSAASLKRRQYRAVGLAMMLLAAALLFSRMLATSLARRLYQSYPYNPYNSMIISAFFSILVQIGVCFLLVFLVYKFTLKMNSKEIFAFSNFNRTKWYNLALAVPIGIVGIFVTIGISTVWAIFLGVLGYNRPRYSAALPATFSPGLFILQIFLIAVLPAICEEFAIRGGLFTVLRNKYRGGMFFVIMAVAFGLFHQNITQLAYTAFFGAIMAFVVFKTKSVYPAMIIHFVNNALSVYLTHARAYGWFMGNIFGSWILEIHIFNLFFGYIAIVAIFIALLVLLAYVNKIQATENVRPYQPAKTQKISLKDNFFFIGAIIITAVFTLYTLILGLSLG